MTRKTKNKKSFEFNRSQLHIPFSYFLFILIWMSIVIYASYFVPVLNDQNSDIFESPKQLYFRFGFNQLHMVNPLLIVVWIAFVFGLIFLSGKGQVLKTRMDKFYKNYHLPKRATRILITSICTLFFWLFRSNFENTDFLLFKQWFPGDVARGLIHVRFDEMWESYIHFELYKLFHSSFGFSMNESFQMISVISGSLFVYIALVLSDELNSEKPYMLFLVLLSGGFMQLFFGDMEYYTIAGMLTFLYLLTSIFFLKEKISLMIPSLVLILAMTFHMEVVFLFPSLIFLFIVQLDTRRYFPILISILLFTGFLSWTFLFFFSKGAFLQRLFDTSWGLGRGGNILANIVEFTPDYFWGQINLLGLIFPPIWFLFPLIFTGGIKKNIVNVFLIISSVGGLLLFFFWTSTIGLYMDWNLFSLPLVPVIMLFAYNFVRQEFPYKKQIILLIFPFSYLMTYSWIISNHLNFK